MSVRDDLDSSGFAANLCREGKEMARETKVGLLAGLAFIICFAVILAHRGGDVFRTPSVIATNSGSLAQGGTPIQSGTPAVERAFDRSVEQVGNALGGKTSAGLGDGFIAAGNTAATPPEAVQASWRKELEDRLDAITMEVRSERDSQEPVSMTGRPTQANEASPPVVHEAQTRPVAGQSYTVAAGDTLSKIAAKFYGSKSTKVVTTIFNANRATMSNPSELRVGAKLVLPEIADVGVADLTKNPEPAVKEPALRPPAKSKQPRDREPPPARWYQVKKNDRYVSIARDQLGDAGRWQEIFELNKDKFPKPGMIREGVRIRLPGATTAASRERRP